MSRISTVLIVAAVYGLAAAAMPISGSAEDSKKEAGTEASETAKAGDNKADADAGAAMSPVDRVKATEKGQLKNPFKSTPEIIAEGKKLYLKNSCNGCHGGGGGGGMCPPLTNETWIYGSDDDTLFRLITLGSDQLRETGFSRVQQEAVKGPMPPYEKIIKKEEDLWKIITYIRSVYKGRPEKADW